MEIFLDDFCTFSTLKDHLSCLSKCLDQCDKYGISLNSDKCTFGVPYEKLLGHIVSLAGIATDPDKVKLILALARPDIVSGERIRGSCELLSTIHLIIRVDLSPTHETTQKASTGRF